MAHAATTVDKAWTSQEKLVKWITWKIIRRYGGEFEELYSEACLLFVQAVQDFDESKGVKLSTWTTIKVYRGLQDLIRVRAARRRLVGKDQKLRDYEQNPSFISTLLKDLSNESKTIVMLLFDFDSERTFKNKSLFKALVRNVMKDRGLSNEEVDHCFMEIEAALIG